MHATRSALNFTHHAQEFSVKWHHPMQSDELWTHHYGRLNILADHQNLQAGCLWDNPFNFLIQTLLGRQCHSSKPCFTSKRILIFFRGSPCATDMVTACQSLHACHSYQQPLLYLHTPSNNLLNQYTYFFTYLLEFPKEICRCVVITTFCLYGFNNKSCNRSARCFLVLDDLTDLQIHDNKTKSQTRNF